MTANADTAQKPAIDRRTILTGAAVAGIGALAAASTIARAEDEHAGHDMKNMEHGTGDHAAPAAYQALVDAALKCINRGEVCVNHCIGSLGKGDTSLKDCLRSVSAMMPMCAALARFAALDAARLKDLAKLCIDVCDDCQKECKKHAEHHASCKACGESCGECIDACKKLT